MTRESLTYTVSMKWSTQLLLLTTTYLLLVVVVSGYGLYNAFASHDLWLILAALAVVGLCAAATVVCEGLAPQYLEFSDDEIVIVRRFSDVVIQRSHVLSVERLSRRRMRWAWRTFGSGGLFGFFGSYYSHRLGNFTLYATSLDNLYQLRTTERTVVVSCDEPEYLFSRPQ